MRESKDKPLRGQQPQRRRRNKTICSFIISQSHKLSRFFKRIRGMIRSIGANNYEMDIANQFHCLVIFARLHMPLKIDCNLDDRINPIKKKAGADG